MIEFDTYRWILLGIEFGLLFIEILILFLLPKRLLASLIANQFAIPRNDKQHFVMNFSGIEIDFLASRRFRISLILQFANIIWIIMLLFVYEWILQIQLLSESDICPQKTSDCFVFKNLISNQRFECEPRQPIMNSNSSNILCFAWVYSDVDAIVILNQIGICSSVYSLLCLSFKLLCDFSRKLTGLILIALFTAGGIATLALALTVKIYISMTGLLVVFGFCGLTINVLQLRQFTSQYQRKIRSLTNSTDLLSF